MTRTIIFVFVLIFYSYQNADAQYNKTVVEVDKISFQQFSDKDWNGLITTGKEAIKNGIDFYYLRYRLGIAYYEKKNYAKAVVHFENIFRTNPNDQLIGEYLYFSYKFCGRTDDAEIISSKFSENLKNKIGIKNPIIENVKIGTTYLFNSEKDNLLDTYIAGNDSVYSEQVVAENQIKYYFGIEHKLFRRVRINYSFSQIKHNTVQSIFDNKKDNLFNLQNTQNQYYINANVHPAKGFDVNFAFNFLNIKGTKKIINYSYENSDLTEHETYEIYDSIYNANATLDIYDTIYNYIQTVESSFSDNNFSQNDYAAALRISKSFSIFRASIFGTYSKLSNKKYKQIGAELIVLPFGNLNLYSMTKLTNKMGKESSSVLSQTVGVKITNFLWSEFNFSIGEMNNYTDIMASMVYNTEETTKKQAGVNCNFYLFIDKLNLSINYTILQNESQYIKYIFDKEINEEYPIVVNSKYTYENGDSYFGEPEQKIVTKTTPTYKAEYINRNSINHVISVGLIWNF